MKPKTRKYRLKRQSSQPRTAANTAQEPSQEVASEAVEAQAVNAQAVNAQPATNHTYSDQPETSQSNSADAPDTTQSSNSAHGPKFEELTPRQLRIARRIAQKHGLDPQSDREAVEMLRARGINPFEKSNIVDLALNKPRADGDSDIQLPQKRKKRMDLPATEVVTAEQRAAEIREIQRDIARRRRIKLGLLLTRLAIFVLLPTLVAGYYFYGVATPMYTTKSEFLILNADGGGGGGRMGGLIPSQYATGQDSIATQSYLESKDAMLRLDRDYGFREAFNKDWIDPIQRLSPEASNEATYKVYKRYVKLGYDQSEGVIRMEVSTVDPETSKIFSEALISYAEERVDQLSQEKRRDAVKTAEEGFEDAKKDRREKQLRLVELQEETYLDPEGEIANIRSLIGAAEAEMQEKQLALNAQLLNSKPNKARVDALRSEIQLLKDTLEKQHARLNDAKDGIKSLAAQTAEIRMAEADVATADIILQSALETLRQNETEADRQVRYMTVSVKPVASQDPSYPKAFEDTLLAFLIFAGIYLMLSLTASILREQVSS